MPPKSNRNELESIAWAALGFSIFLHVLLFVATYFLWVRAPLHASLGAGYVTVDLGDFGEGGPGGTSPKGVVQGKKKPPLYKSKTLAEGRLGPTETEHDSPVVQEIHANGKGEGHGQGIGIGDGTGGTGSGTGEGTGSGGGDGSLSQYIGQVLAKIERKKQYPRLSQQNGEEGVVLVDLRIGRSGQLLSYNFRKAPPRPRLIEATKSAIQAAAPFPSLPENYAQESLNLQVPVRYQLH